MATVDEIKIRIRQRLTEIISANPNAGNFGFVMTDIITEELFGESSGMSVVDDFFNPSSGLPNEPDLYDVYIATATAHGWTVKNMYIYGDEDLGWIENAYALGRIVYVVSQDKWYGAKSAGWTEFSGGGSSGIENPIILGSAPFMAKIELQVSNDKPELIVSLTTNGGSTWDQKQRFYYK